MTNQGASCRLDGRTAIVLGGGFAMGEAVTMTIASHGANVAVVDVIEERALRVAAAASEFGVTALPIVADVTHEREVLDAFDKADIEIGAVELLVNVVGMANWSSVLELTDEVWEEDFSRNLRYVLRACRRFAAGVLSRGSSGAVVNISSMSALGAAPGHSAYGAAKAALISLTMSMAEEWGPHVRLNAIAPGKITVPRSTDTPEIQALHANSLPLKRLGTPYDVANVALFLLSDLASYVTGHTIPVDGGVKMSWPFAKVPSEKFANLATPIQTDLR